MAKLFASWVPGYAVVAQKMGDQALIPAGWSFGDCNGHREGSGVSFFTKGGEENANWYHAPIPTPVMVEGQRARLGRVMVLFDLEQGVELHSVHVWDGPNRIMQRDGLSISGDHTHGLDGDNTFDVNHEGIQWGVGISLLISALGDNLGIYFAGAGADFYHNI